MAKDPDIKRRMDRVEEIIDQLDADEVSLDEGKRLHEMGEKLLDEIREHHRDEEGEIIEIE